jgi:hypothetical protein
MSFIRYNTNENGYVANYVELPDVGDAQFYDGPLPENFQEVCRFCRMVDGVMMLDEARMLEVREKEARRQAIIEEITTLEAWLAEFDRQNAEYRRCMDLGLPYAGNIEALKAEAAAKYTRLLELRAQFGEG